MSETEISQILNQAQVVAIVGASDQIGKHSHRVAAYLKQHGYKIIPINPSISGLFGEKSYNSLLAIPPRIQARIDIVDVFRKSEDVLPIVDQAIELKRRLGRSFVVWLQEGIVNEVAAEKACQAGLTVVMDKCLMKEHMHRHKTMQPQE
ncbi:MAG TPA: CoA-binding protein [Candidatus Acidoferrales bacterium]|nr:CoA-binding protein [Candidatus Acidoferrales bacterium]